MIKITVRHSQRTNTLRSDLQQQQQQPHTMTSESQREPNSIVEIKYRHSTAGMAANRQAQDKSIRQQHERLISKEQAADGMSHLFHDNQQAREAKQQQQQQRRKPAPIHNRIIQQNQHQKARPTMPRGSLSSCSSSSPELSGAEEAAEYYQSYMAASVKFNQELDEDSMDECHNSSVFDEAPLAGVAEQAASSRAQAMARARQVAASSGQQQQQLHSKTASGVRGMRANRNKLHARSISLIVNPNFGLESGAAGGDVSSSSEDDENDGQATFKRRNSIVPSRLAARRASPTSVDKNNSKVRQASEEPTQTLPEQSPDYSSAKSAVKPVETELVAKSEEEQTIRLREIGFILRQISDEFSRNRRLTV